MLTVEELREEISHLQQEVQQKDLLVQQLSEELFRLIKGNNVFVPTQEVSHQRYGCKLNHLGSCAIASLVNQLPRSCKRHAPNNVMWLSP